MSASIKPKKTLEIIDPMELKKRMAAKERCVLRAIQPFQIVLIISVVSCLFWFYSLLSTIQYAIDAAKSLRDDQHIFHDGLQQVPDLVKAFIVGYQLMCMLGIGFSMVLAYGVCVCRTYMFLPWITLTRLYFMYHFCSAIMIIPGLITWLEFTFDVIQFVFAVSAHYYVMNYIKDCSRFFVYVRKMRRKNRATMTDTV